MAATVAIRGGSKAISRAFAKAGQLGPAIRLEGSYHGQRWFRVLSASRSGVTHLVRVDEGGRVYGCSCEAAMAGRVCWHRAAVVTELAGRG